MRKKLYLEITFKMIVLNQKHYFKNKLTLHVQNMGLSFTRQTEVKLTYMRSRCENLTFRRNLFVLV